MNIIVKQPGPGKNYYNLDQGLIESSSKCGIGTPPKKSKKGSYIGIKH